MSDHSRVSGADPWLALRAYTAARIALGRSGQSLPTAEVLNFGLAHAQARDAIHTPLDTDLLCAALQQEGWDSLTVQSQAQDRTEYLLRPDLGRRLAQGTLLPASGQGVDIGIVIGDGLSSLAVQRHAVPLLQALRALLNPEFRVSPIVVATQARVALADDIASRLGVRLVVMLIGERPGLSSPDSLGIYLSYAPWVGMSDAQRNCISNVRPEGLGYAAAAFKLNWLINQALRLHVTGVGLKDESDLLLTTIKSPARIKPPQG
jgi:ethanolamine ammonia-lyase small subunit